MAHHIWSETVLATYRERMRAVRGPCRRISPAALSVNAGDTQPMRLQHHLDVLPAFLVTQPRPTARRIQDKTNGAVERERASQVLMETALVVRDGQLDPEYNQR